jgi:hypothetical protein
MMWPRLKADHSPLPISEVDTAWNNTYTSPQAFMLCSETAVPSFIFLLDKCGIQCLSANVKLLNII